jgi:hypothetical protein
MLYLLRVSPEPQVLLLSALRFLDPRSGSLAVIRMAATGDEQRIASPRGGRHGISSRQ